MSRTAPLILFVLTVLTACADDTPTGPEERATPVTTATATARDVEDVERSIGRLVADARPSIAAETSGRIRAVNADIGDPVAAGDLLAEIDDEVQRIAVQSAQAERTRLQALLDNERRRVRRLEGLAERQSIAQDQLDEAETAVASLTAQLEAARARLEDAQYQLRQTRIVSPVDGRIEARLISVGDYVAPSMPVFRLIAGQALQARLPLPEHLQGGVSVGQPVELFVPARPEERISAEVSDIRPSVGEGSSAIELVVYVDDQPGWRAGGSVSARVILSRHEGVVVPPVSVVRRPAGDVVYVIEGQRVRQQPVTIGIRGAGWVEVLEGLQAGDRVAADGAGFLTDGARVTVESHGTTP
jgi:RND family efflux transporter MFP subunit